MIGAMNYETSLDTDDGQQDGHRGNLIGSADGSRRRKTLLIAAAVAAGLILIFYFMRGGKDTGLGDGSDAALPVVSVVSAATTTITGKIETTGTLAARRELPVGSVGDGGRVAAVNVDAGQWVRKGQTLAVIDRSVQSQQVVGQAAQVDVARADAALAEANLGRALKLVDRGFISKAEVDLLRATRDAAAGRVRVAQAQLAELRARTARLDIVAPAAGLLLTRNVEPGQVVGPSSGVLFSIARGGELELTARVSEEDLAQLSVGVRAEVTPTGSEKSFSGQIWQISPTIDDQNRQGTARIALAYAPELRPGGFAAVTINSGTMVAPLLPESAILSDEAGRFVLVLGKDDTLVRRAVKTGFVTAQGIAIRDGLSGNEKIVLRAGGFLSAGDRIKPHLVKQPAG